LDVTTAFRALWQSGNKESKNVFSTFEKGSVPLDTFHVDHLGAFIIDKEQFGQDDRA